MDMEVRGFEPLVFQKAVLLRRRLQPFCRERKRSLAGDWEGCYACRHVRTGVFQDQRQNGTGITSRDFSEPPFGVGP
jgi:hypothetical protein